MTGRHATFILLFAGFIIVPISSTAAREEPAPPRSAKKLSTEQLIERLDSDEFATREAAMRELMERAEAMPALRRALPGATLEMRRRIELILEEQHLRTRSKRVRRLLDHLKNGEIDLFIERAVADPKDVDEKVWLALFDLLDRMREKVNRAQHIGVAMPPVLGDDREQWARKIARLNPLTPDKQIGLVRTVTRRRVSRDWLYGSVVVSGGGVCVAEHFDNNIILANGDVRYLGKGLIGSSIILCDGCIEGKFPNNSILIATGTISLKNEGSANSFVLEKAREALDVLKFYDPRQAGLETTESPSGLRVEKVLAGKPFARAGVRRGDCILAVDGEKILHLAEFRRLLRRDIVADVETVVTIGRAGKQAAEVTVRLGE